LQLNDSNVGDLAPPVCMTTLTSTALPTNSSNNTATTHRSTNLCLRSGHARATGMAL